MIENLSRDEVLSLRFEERIPYLNKIVVNYRRGNELLEMMEECYQNCLDGATQPPGIMIVGPSGAGKSTLVDLFVARHPVAKTEMGKIVPVLKFTVEAPANKGNLVSSFLEAFGDPLYDRGLIGTRSNRIKGYIDDCKTAMIIADEIQHFVDPDKRKLLLDVSNWFKNLIKAKSIACVLVGMEKESELILEANKQLGRLFPDPLCLEPFAFSTTDSTKDFRVFLADLEDQLPLAKASGLSDYKTAKKIHEATDGLIGYVMELVRTAGRAALNSHQEKIDEVELARAFRKRLAPERRKKSNPFDE
jgi:hypothetical protein